MPRRRTGRTRQSSPRPWRPPHRVPHRRPQPRWARPRHPGPARQPRDWIQISVTALPGLAAVIALIFTWVAVNATNNQLQITEQGQITDRYNAAITNLGSRSVDVRLGGIYALQRIMQDSPRDQPTVVAVLCAFVRDHANAATTKSAHLPASPDTSPAPRQLPTDIQAALTVVGIRNTAHDGSTTVVDFTGAQLAGGPDWSESQRDEAHWGASHRHQGHLNRKLALNNVERRDPATAASRPFTIPCYSTSSRPPSMIEPSASRICHWPGGMSPSVTTSMPRSRSMPAVQGGPPSGRASLTSCSATSGAQCSSRRAGRCWHRAAPPYVGHDLISHGALPAGGCLASGGAATRRGGVPGRCGRTCG